MCESFSSLQSGHKLRLGSWPFQFALRLSLLDLVCLCFGFANVYSFQLKTNVIPAKAGIYVFHKKFLWIPAYAGMTYSYISYFNNFFKTSSLGSVSFALQPHSPVLRSVPHCRHMPLHKSVQRGFMGRLSVICSFMRSRRSRFSPE